MYDTNVTIIGNVLTAPEWRRTTQTGTLVANFKVASTARRLDRENNRWVDGNSLRVRVNCWRKLAEGVASSLMVGDPVVVVGRMYTRDWTDTDGNHRVMYELEAVAVGHDLSRGRAKFVRNRPALSTSAVADPEAESRVQGQETEPVPVAETPAGRDDLFDDDDPDFADVPAAPVPHYDPLAEVRGTGFPPAGPSADPPAPADPGRPGAGDGPEGLSGAGPALPTGPGGAPEDPSAGERDGVTGEADAGPPEPSGPANGAPGPSGLAVRGRRGRARVPVPA
ncbi:single-stranded DNA-binding protein [Polymorphospora rubra]|uniref:single-stranded DNA-binding protein n=1 Tax=Polymorphospora rubra TaxID=338584 RepID=UPI0034029A47